MSDPISAFFRDMPLHTLVSASEGAALDPEQRERNRARALLLAKGVCDGVPEDVLLQMVDHLLRGGLPRNYAEGLVHAEVRRERLIV